MRRPRVRITIRGVMLAVASVAFLIRGGIWFEEMRQRRTVALLAASRKELELFDYGQFFKESCIEDRVNSKGLSRAEAEVDVRKEMNEIAEKARVYQRAADRPWLTLPLELADKKPEDFEMGPGGCGYLLKETGGR